MKTTIETKTAGKITINSEYIGDKLWAVSDKMNNYNNHKVTISHKGKTTSFDFWGSIAEPEIRDDQANVFAFYCFLSDGLSAKDSFDYFCAEVGYDSDSRTAERIYKLCKKSLKKAERVFDCDLYDLINEVQETYNC